MINNDVLHMHNNGGIYKYCGKILLFGEHLIFRGLTAIGMPIRQCMYTKNDNNDKRKELKKFAIELYSNMSGTEKENSIILPGDFYVYLNDLCEKQKLLLPKRILVIQSDIPCGCGLGSSAALSCILSHMLLEHNNMSIELKNIWHLAHDIEHYFHSPAFGVDTALSAYNRDLYITALCRKEKELHPSLTIMPAEKNIKNILNIVYGVIPRDRICADTVALVSQKLKENTLYASIEKRP